MKLKALCCQFLLYWATNLHLCTQIFIAVQMILSHLQVLQTSYSKPNVKETTIAGNSWDSIGINYVISVLPFPA